MKLIFMVVYLSLVFFIGQEVGIQHYKHNCELVGTFATKWLECKP